MPHYVQRGTVPRKRHIQFRKPDGTLYSEQVFGTKGFSGIASILYHLHPPTQVQNFEPLMDLRPALANRQALRHHHLRTAGAQPQGDAISGRIPLLVNANVTLSLCCPKFTMPYLYKNADGDELIFVHEGQGTLHTMFGPLTFGEGDYLVIPRGTIYQLELLHSPMRLLVVEAVGGPIEVPKRYRNEYGQLLEHAPFCERDIRVPETLEVHEETGHFEVRIKAQGALTAYHYNFHPFDVVGWDGYLYPWAFNIHDFEPITGSLHQPPPTHQTFSGPNFVVCSFVPRMLDYHPEAVPIPYNHSNVDSDEVLYYVNGNFSSRRGIERGSITLHPAGLPHGPQPGAVEASLGLKRTEEMAVMLDTFYPLQITEAALAFDDPTYPKSWLPRS
ncbi:MAG TPA: homogentisate 1,2-dioxygenase [Chthonomonas sp.]|uniref:homogentisate 1,2-dioxygenase n=1 Tax=Chthonomonas sp. TaxID=2282153 RepID=UPI002B4AD9D2|nr:homogentisate 1,2-dioxygenase [Chthonomonas sp.]HLI49512.1 homogentisate 1,2-dioxygenase [Chthonomonas sp.]